jgi:Family of unknown function (DUF5994)
MSRRGVRGPDGGAPGVAWVSPRTFRTPTVSSSSPPARSDIPVEPPAGETVDDMTTSAPAPADARLSLSAHPGARHTAVDGAWWPRSTDLAAELPSLVAALDARGVRIARISYALSAWDPTPHRVEAGGRIVRTGGFRVIDPALVSLTPAGGAGAPVELRVVPPDTAPEVAARKLASAGTGAEPDRPPMPAPRPAPAQETASEGAWESEGGHLTGRSA